jgi:2-polyprenyl-3-methyl-5-hydroxy-6-metoxy-1,4-benzoquinol methylase
VAHPERIIPDETERGVVALHAVRYEFALERCAGRDVLDAGCGVGYGSALLASRARRVVGVDLDPQSVEYARRRYGAANVEFEVMNVQALDFADATFDVVCCFENIEHVDDAEAAVRELVRVLRPGGTLFVSTPQAAETTYEPENPFHRVEFSARDFEALLRRHVATVALYGQHRVQTRRHRALQRLDVLGLRRRVALLRRLARPVTGTASTEELGAADVAIRAGDLAGASELIAVCTT